MKRVLITLALLVVTSSIAMLPFDRLRALSAAEGRAQSTQPAPPDRDQALKLMQQGQYKEACEIFSQLAVDPKDDPRRVGQDMTSAISSLQSLGRVDEIDAFREKVIAAHSGNWRLLHVAAQSYMYPEHDGFIIAGAFKRGQHRGGGRYVNAFERDRVRALQLMQQATEKIKGDLDKAEAGEFYHGLTDMLLANRGYNEAWRLQYLTDLATLPDYEEGNYYSGGSRGAPVDENGQPIFHHQPKSWKEATTDGQRWRWALVQMAEAGQQGEAMRLFADFLLNQFGVQTMQEYRWFFARARTDDETRKDDPSTGSGSSRAESRDESGTYELHTLRQDETIARLASGIKRFKLPDEFNFIRIYQELKAFDSLAPIFEDRRQYLKAAEYWRQAIARDGPGENQWRQKRLDQIVKPWGLFEPILTAPAGQGATLEFRYRNGNKVSFVAEEIDTRKLLADVKDYLKSNPKQLDWHKMDVGEFGYRLLEDKQAQYLKKGPVATWELDLKPLPNHFDKRITVATPLQKPGAYWLTATMADGNTCHVVIWVADTAIVSKPLDQGSHYFFVADAVTGEPVAKANLEFFGYRQKWINDGGGQGHYDTSTRDFAEFTDADGQCMPKTKDQDSNYQWIITATTPDGRFAYLGFTGIWHGRYYDQEYNQPKTYVITDRPVYRPAQTVKFKFWVNTAKYDQEGKSAFAGRPFNVRVNDPKGEKVFEKSYTADEYGGFDGELPPLNKEATLGVYRIFLTGAPGGGGSFRVEEYKKPEFEVKVEAPKEPVMLGEKITATIQAKYYFGAPVTEGKVKYKVLRTSQSDEWYAPGPWDWFYGSGYWWFACDYPWYPGWREWGCRRPAPMWWWQWHPRQPPEVVAEAEAPVGKDGTIKVEIDTAVAKAVHGDTDHKYEITAEVTDQSRRTIVGTGSVLVARKPFKVYAWVNCGYFRVGDAIEASLCARTPDGKPVKGKGELRLLKISYEKEKDTGRLKPVEKEVRKWALDTNEEGQARQPMKASEAGQFRISYRVADDKKHVIEGGYVFVVRGQGVAGDDFRFNDIELVTDKKEYQPEDKVKLLVNTSRADSTVLLFARAANGCYLPPKVLRLKGKSAVEEIEVLKKDMPNFYVEGLTVSGGKVYTEVREVIVPPEKRVLNVQVVPSAAGVSPAAGTATGDKDAAETAAPRYKPGEKAKVKIKVTDAAGEPYSGSTVVAVYDKAVEYISGGSNVPEIKEFFWKWRRRHNPNTNSSLRKGSSNRVGPGQIAMAFLGVFGYSVADEVAKQDTEEQKVDPGAQFARGGGGFDKPSLTGWAGQPVPSAALAPGRAAEANGLRAEKGVSERIGERAAPGGEAPAAMVEPTVRTQFADTALWVAALQTDKGGEATVELTMPENLTTWKARVWAMGLGTKVGEGAAEVVTTKNLIIRLQAPRFFVQKDEVVLSANVHNYLKTKKNVLVRFELEGNTLEPVPVNGKNAFSGLNLAVEPGGEIRVNGTVKVVQPGLAVIRMSARTDEESDATEMKFPVFVHGMLKTESFSGVIRPEKDSATITVNVPKERMPEQTRLEVRYSPTLAGAMVDALPYLVDYPYGCTEQTLNRFLPTVITQKVLLGMGLDLKDIQKKQTNLNAQEIGDDKERAKDWAYRGGYMSRATAQVKNPVFDEGEVRDMVKTGINRLTSMQCADGGWGEQSWPHTTAVVVHGLQTARANDVAIVPGVLERGVEWLKRYQAEELRRLKLPMGDANRKPKADAIDALVYMVLVDEKADNKEMREFLYRDRLVLPVYAQAMFGLALHTVGDKEKRDVVVRNLDQYLVQDDENQTAYLKLPQNNWWWCWYGSEYEAQAYYLKLLCAVDPKGQKPARLVKYLLNNRKHASYWNSTRDTAIVIEAFAAFLKASGEDSPDLTVEVHVDGKKVKEVKIDKGNLFSFDNKLVLAGKDLADGKHAIELRRKGKGSVYFNAYLTNFTLEDPIARAGLEIKVNRKFYKLLPVEKKIKVEGARGQALEQKVEKFQRQPLENLAALKSGDMVEIELVIESKNDYEYILFEDMKAAGFEPVEVRSGYGDNEMGAYMELRDERVTFFVRTLARGTHSISYRMRAEIPGAFSALPTKASAMYAPELKANSDEFKVKITD